MKKVITTVIESELEKEFRQLAYQKFMKKGYFSKALGEAIRDWIKKEKMRNILILNLELLKKGIKTKKWRFKREEIYER